MGVFIVIPARYASTRYPGKALAALKGASGASKPLIQRTWDAACAAARADGAVDRVIVATDDEKVAEPARAFGAEVAITSERCRNGTERCAEMVTLGLLPSDDDTIIVNVQGDAPLTPPYYVTALIDAMRADPGIAVATPALRCDGASLERFKEDRRNGRVGATTAVFKPGPGGKPGDALYFSKEVIPFTAKTYAPDDSTPVFHHVGLYAYRPWALKAYLERGEGTLESLEGLEQLRFLEMGERVRVVEVISDGRDFCELNNPVDVGRIERALKALGVE